MRVISNRLADDIRDAVKRAFKDADKDIDAEGKKAGERLGKSMADSAGDSIKKDMERTVGKEVVLATRRLAITAGNSGDDAGRNWGTRFMASAGNGIRDNDSIIGRQLSEAMVRAISSNDFDRRGSDLGGNLARMIGQGLEENAASEIGTPFRRSIVRELESGSRGALVRASDVDSKLFMRNFVEGLRQGQDRLNDQLRRSFMGAVRDQEADLANGFRRVFVGSVDAIQDDVTTAFHRTMRNATPDGDDSETKRGWRAYARNVAESLAEGFRVESGRLRAAGRRLSDRVRDGIDERREQVANAGDRLVNRVEQGMLRRFPRTVAFAREWGQRVGAQFGNGLNEDEGERAADRVTRGLRRGMNRNRAGLGSLFSDIGNSLFRHFNLGFGAARMGAAIISVIATAAPSILAGLGAIITALIADLVNLAAALGPGLAGAVGVGLAAVSSLALNFGLLMAAFKLSGTVLKDFSEDFKAFGELIGTPIAKGMLPGLQEMLESLKSILPEINDLLTATGERFGAMFSSLGGTLAGQENVGRIREILLNNLTFIDNFSAGINGLATSFLILFAASKPFIDYVGEGIRRFGEWAAASLAVSEANGNLAAWMDGMLASFRDLWAIVKNFGSGIGNIFSAAAPAGESLLASIRGIAERFKAWTSDEGNMARMTAFFEKARTLSSAVLDLLGGIFTAGGNAFAAMDLGPILSVLDTLQNVIAPAIARLFNQIQAGASENLVKAFENIGTALTKIADNGTFVIVADIISDIIEKITELAASDFGSTILSWVLPIALMGGIVTSLLGPLFSLGSALISVGTAAAGISAPVIAIAAAVAAAVAAFVVMWNNSEELRNSISELGSAVGGAFMDVWDKLSAKIGPLWEKFQELAGVIGDRLAPVIQFITPIIARVITFIGDLLGNIIDAVIGFMDIIIGIFTGNWQQIWEGVKQVFSAAWNQILTVFQMALSVISFVWDAITAVIYNAGQVIWGFLTSVWTGVANVAYTVWNAIYAFFETIFNAITGAITSFGNAIPPFLAGVWQWIQNTAVTVWNAIYAFFENIFNTITNAIRTFGNAIPPFLASVWEWIRSTAVSVWNAIYAFFEGIFNTITGAIRSFGNGIQTIWNTVWNAVSTTVRSIVGSIGSWLSERWNDIKSAVSSAWNGLAGIVGAIWEGVKNAIVQPIADAWNLVSGWVSKIAGLVSGILSTVTSAVTEVNGKLESIMADQRAATSVSESMLTQAGPMQTPSILSPEGIGGGIQRMLMEHVMNIPGLATGGIVPAVPGGTVFRLGEGGKSERVEPLDSSGLSARDRAMIKSIVGATVSMMSGGGVNVDVTIGEQGLDNFVTKTIRRENDALARRVGKVRR